MRIRPERVGHMMQREIADILANKLRDPRLGAMVSVTDVEVTPDLSFARVFVSILPQDQQRDRVLEGLQNAAGFVRRELAPRLGLREVPELRFLLDTSSERGARVEDLLRRLSKGENIQDEEEES
ncbi:MAG TPA: 30S ribosome-binding factor RbfA [Candidatus Sulfotelmatobacter sp.]|nr:30S ribosome-binding factor RbfA [Candidatus Sulfotelmatobacter sp.]